MKKTKLNILDDVISFFSPEMGFKRAQRRKAIEILQRGYEGARTDRRTAGWTNGNDDKPLNLTEAKILKNRSRDLYRNNPYSFRAHNSIANNATGIGIVPAIQNERLKLMWKNWAKSIHVDIDEVQNFYGLQNLIMRTISMHGEVLVLRVPTTTTDRVPLSLKVINTKLLDPIKDTLQTPGGGYIEGGIEYNQQGQKIGYWIYPRDPHQHIDDSVYWDAKDVIHLFFQDEPGQMRGVPFGTPSMMSLRDFDDYSDAQLTRQKIAACFAIFITKTDAEIGGFNNIDAQDDGLDYVEPGMIQKLEPGKNVTFASPPAAEGFGEYSRNVLTGIASGYGMSYESMTGDLSNVNYSSGRMGFIEYQRMIENWQHLMLIPRFCQVVWRWFLAAASLLGPEFSEADTQIEWTAPGRKMIDPVKEVQGLVDQVRAGFMSWQEAVRKLGYSPEEIFEEMKIAKKLFDEAGLHPQSDARFDATKMKNETETEINEE